MERFHVEDFHLRTPGIGRRVSVRMSGEHSFHPSIELVSRKNLIKALLFPP